MIENIRYGGICACLLVCFAHAPRCQGFEILVSNRSFGYVCEVRICLARLKLSSEFPFYVLNSGIGISSNKPYVARVWGLSGIYIFK